MAKQVTMKKGQDIIKCSEDHIEHFQNIGYSLQGEKKGVKKSEKVLKQENKEENK